MVGYPRALRTAHHLVSSHPADARAYVARKIAAAVRAGHGAQAAEWHKVEHFVERLLEARDPGPPEQPRHHRPPPRYRRVRAPDPR
jgi:hypothetical protein